MKTLTKLYTRYIKPALDWIARKLADLVETVLDSSHALVQWHRNQVRTNPHYKPALLVLAVAILQTLAADSVAGVVATQLIVFLRTVDSDRRSTRWDVDDEDSGSPYGDWR